MRGGDERRGGGVEEHLAVAVAGGVEHLTLAVEGEKGLAPWRRQMEGRGAWQRAGEREEEEEPPPVLRDKEVGEGGEDRLGFDRLIFSYTILRGVIGPSWAC